MKTSLCFLFLLLANFAFGQTYAIIADKLVDGSSDHAFNNPTVIVKKNKIVSVNFTGSIPDSATVINLKGYTLLPGLIDCHTHLLADGGDYDKDPFGHSPAYRALRAVKYAN